MVTMKVAIQSAVNIYTNLMLAKCGNFRTFILPIILFRRHEKFKRQVRNKTNFNSSYLNIFVNEFCDRKFEDFKRRNMENTTFG